MSTIIWDRVALGFAGTLLMGIAYAFSQQATRKASALTPVPMKAYENRKLRKMREHPSEGEEWASLIWG